MGLLSASNPAFFMGKALMGLGGSLASMVQQETEQGWDECF
jgi:hypothetical protein